MDVIVLLRTIKRDRLYGDGPMRVWRKYRPSKSKSESESSHRLKMCDGYRFGRVYDIARLQRFVLKLGSNSNGNCISSATSRRINQKSTYFPGSLPSVTVRDVSDFTFSFPTFSLPQGICGFSMSCCLWHTDFNLACATIMTWRTVQPSRICAGCARLGGS
jgi:hypothetical protein